MPKLATLLSGLLFLLTISACTTLSHEEPNSQPHEAQVLDIVWNGYFKAKADPPEVFWWFGTCPNDAATADPAVVLHGKCYAGLFRPELWRADVAWYGSFSKSAYAHELMHSYQWTRGISDPRHESDEWMLVDIINADLASKGF